MPEKIVIPFLSQCSQCGCKRASSIPKSNLAGIDVADLVAAYCMLEEAHAAADPKATNYRITLAMRALHASGHIAGEEP